MVKHNTVRIPADLTDEMDKLIGKHGYRSRSEIAKDAIREFLEKRQEETVLLPLPRFEQITFNEKEVKLLDRKIQRVVDVQLNDGWCSYCQSKKCEHIDYVLSRSAKPEP